MFFTYFSDKNKKDFDKKVINALGNKTYFKEDFNFNNTKFKNNNDGSLWVVPR